ncbi:MAG: hypothetical protein JRJ01_01035 [Deltaproteobacteria bacterium]|nr:hypothetical protein [Deltaproteobacteria bacterium]
MKYFEQTAFPGRGRCTPEGVGCRRYRTAQGKQIKSRFPLLEVVHGRFCQKFRGTLSSALRKMVDVTNNPIGTIRYSDFQRSLPVPTSMHLFKMADQGPDPPRSRAGISHPLRSG